MPAFSEYTSFDGLGLANLVKTGIISPRELLEAAISAIELLNPQLNAVIYKAYDQADELIKQNLIPPGMFQGVPFLLKDMLAEYKGMPIQFGSRLTTGYISSFDSLLVQRMKQAGLVIIGKTNVPEFGLSPVTEPELFGPTHNPWDLTRNAGGSSGGSAAAVASRMVPMAHGNDGGGSIRIPASYCGVFGLKPTRGRTPVGPQTMRVWQGMAVDHVLTRSVRDSAAMLDVLAGPELGSPISLPTPTKSFLSSMTEPVRPLRIAITDQPFFASAVHPDSMDAFKKAVTLCEELGHTMLERSPIVATEEVLLAYMIVIAGEMAAGLTLLADLMQRKIDYHLLEISTAVLAKIGDHFSASDFAWANQILDKVSYQSAVEFTHYDMLMMPTMPGPPPLIGEYRLDFIEHSLLELIKHVSFRPLLSKLVKQIAERHLAFTPFTPLFNITGQPAMSVPLFWDNKGLPVGIQFAARCGDEYSLFQLANQLEQAQPWSEKCPTGVRSNRKVYNL